MDIYCDVCDTMVCISDAEYGTAICKVCGSIVRWTIRVSTNTEPPDGFDGTFDDYIDAYIKDPEIYLSKLAKIEHQKEIDKFQKKLKM